MYICGGVRSDVRDGFVRGEGGVIAVGKHKVYWFKVTVRDWGFAGTFGRFAAMLGMVM